MTWEEVKELGPLYVIGALDVETLREVENFMRRATPEQKREFAEWHEVAAIIPVALPQTEVPAHLKDRLLSRLAATGEPELQTQTPQTAKVISFQPRQRSESSLTRWMLMAATIALALSCGYLGWKNTTISARLKQTTLTLEETDHRLNTLTRQLEAFLSPSTRVISMSGIETPQAHAKVVWNTEAQTWEVHIKNLPPPPSDKDYQLWYVTKDAKINAAVFSTDNSGRGELKLSLPAEALHGLSATAVTLEPKGGSPQPTGKFYLLASI